MTIEEILSQHVKFDRRGKEFVFLCPFHEEKTPSCSMNMYTGMFHCFAGSKEVLKNALNLGFFIGFDGNSTYPGLAPKETVELKDLISYTPLDRIVTETDSPFLTPIPHRGERNMPEYVILVGEYIARIKGVSFEQIVEQTTQNVYTVFTRLN